MTLLEIIDQHDREQLSYIRELEDGRERDREKIAELTGQLVGYVDTVDRMKLDLILGGSLQRPGKVEALTRRVALLEEALRFYANEDERNGWGGTARAALDAPEVSP